MASFSWSYSALTAFETCPWRYYLTKIKKEVVEPTTPATAEGRQAHKALELHLTGQQWLPEKYKAWVPLAERVKQTEGRLEVERRYALTSSYRETDYYAKDVWLRVVFDVQVVRPRNAIVLDWKTGKRKLDIDQNKLFAATAFELHPNINEVRTGYIWLKEMKLDTQTYQRQELPQLWQDFSARVHRMEKAVDTGDFPKRPSGLCRQWCPVGKARCEHCGT